MSTKASPLASDDAPAPGTIVAGKYRVERVLGVGGMGVVVAATHEVLGELVAIKFLKTTDSEDRIKRFVREARAAAKIRSDYVARVYDVGQLEDGTPYLVMEYLDGEDLSQRLKSMGPLPIEEAVEYTLQACEAIATAHARGIVHRDLKPSNLFLATRNDGTSTVKVIDFGISKVLNDDPSQDEDPGGGITKSATLLGSPLYMSPEQMVSARDVDGRCDVWALGGILYALLAGRPPFRGLTVAAIYESILNGAPPIRQHRPEVPAGLESALAHALIKDRDARTHDVASFARDIGPFGPDHARVLVERVQRMLQGRTSLADPSGESRRSSSLPAPTSGRGGEGGLAASQPSANPSVSAGAPLAQSSARALSAAPASGALPAVEPTSATAASWSREKTPMRRVPVGLYAIAGIGIVAVAGAVYFAVRAGQGGNASAALSASAPGAAAASPATASGDAKPSTTDAVQPPTKGAASASSSSATSADASANANASASASTVSASGAAPPVTTGRTPPPRVPPPPGKGDPDPFGAPR